MQRTQTRTVLKQKKQELGTDILDGSADETDLADENSEIDLAGVSACINMSMDIVWTCRGRLPVYIFPLDSVEPCRYPCHDTIGVTMFAGAS